MVALQISQFLRRARYSDRIWIVRRPGTHLSLCLKAKESDDKVEILSGVFDGKSTGTPISIINLEYEDKRSRDYESY